MNKNRWIAGLSLVLVLLAVSVWYLNRYQELNKAGLTADRDFAIKDVSEIHRVLLKNPVGDSICLDRQANHWIVNGTYKAFPNSVMNLLDALSSIRMQSIPSKGYYKNIMDGFRGMGIKVKIFDRNGELLKSYIVGGTTQQEYGTYFLMDGFKQPYIMEIPHFIGNVRERYDLNLTDWRDRTLIDIPSAEIEEVRVDYPYHMNNSFRILKDENQIKFFDVQESTQSIPVKNRKLLTNYLESMSQLGAEGIQNQNPNRKKISEMTPFCQITVRHSGESIPLVCKFYPIKDDSTGSRVNLDADFLAEGNFFRFYVDRSDGDFLVVQYQVMKPLLWSKYDFLGK